MINNDIPLPKYEKEAYAFDMGGDPLKKLAYPTPTLLGLAIQKKWYRRVKGLRKTLIMHVSGEHQSWKSIFASRLAFTLDPTFTKPCPTIDDATDNFRKRVIHSPESFLDAIQDIQQNNIFGAALVIDEAGASMNKQAYYEKIIQAVNKTIQILGKYRVIIIFVSPVRDFIVASLRKMTHVYIHADRYSNEFTHLTVYNIKFNPYKEVPYKEKIRIRLFGSKIIVPNIKLYKSPTWLIDKYHIIEDERKPALLEQIREDGMAGEIQKKERVDTGKIIADVVERWDEFKGKKMLFGTISLHTGTISEKFNLSQFKASYIKRAAEVILEQKLNKGEIVLTKQRR